MLFELNSIAEVCYLDVGNIHDALAQRGLDLDCVLSRVYVVLYQYVLRLQVSMDDVKPFHQMYGQ